MKLDLCFVGLLSQLLNCQIFVLFHAIVCKLFFLFEFEKIKYCHCRTKKKLPMIFSDMNTVVWEIFDFFYVKIYIVSKLWRIFLSQRRCKFPRQWLVYKHLFLLSGEICENWFDLWVRSSTEVEMLPIPNVCQCSEMDSQAFQSSQENAVLYVFCHMIYKL